MSKPEKITAADLTKKVVPYCPSCGSSSVLCEAFVLWNERLNRWDIADLLDGNTVCNNCGQGCEIKWKLAS